MSVRRSWPTRRRKLSDAAVARRRPRRHHLGDQARRQARVADLLPQRRPRRLCQRRRRTRPRILGTLSGDLQGRALVPTKKEAWEAFRIGPVGSYKTDPAKRKALPGSCSPSRPSISSPSRSCRAGAPTMPRPRPPTTRYVAQGLPVRDRRPQPGRQLRLQLRAALPRQGQGAGRGGTIGLTQPDDGRLRRVKDVPICWCGATTSTSDLWTRSGRAGEVSEALIAAAARGLHRAARQGHQGQLAHADDGPQLRPGGRAGAEVDGRCGADEVAASSVRPRASSAWRRNPTARRSTSAAYRISLSTRAAVAASPAWLRARPGPGRRRRDPDPRGSGSSSPWPRGARSARWKPTMPRATGRGKSAGGVGGRPGLRVGRLLLHAELGYVREQPGLVLHHLQPPVGVHRGIVLGRHHLAVLRLGGIPARAGCRLRGPGRSSARPVGGERPPLRVGPRHVALDAPERPCAADLEHGRQCVANKAVARPGSRGSQTGAPASARAPRPYPPP